jgi:hypothetical protein
MSTIEQRVMDLPNDLQYHIHDMVQRLRAPKQTLPADVLLDLSSFHLFKFVENRYMHNPDFSADDPTNNDYYLFWMDNDFGSMINDNVALMDGVQPKLQACFPTLNAQQILAYMTDNTHTVEEIHKLVKKYWLKMSPMQRVKLFLEC